MADETWRAFVEERADGLDEAAAQDQAWQEVVPLLRGRPFEEHWEAYQAIFGDRREDDPPPIVWRPGEETLQRAHLEALRKELGLDSYADLHAWSAADRADFWKRSIEALGIHCHEEPSSILEGDDPEEPTWLPGARFNAADACFQADPGKTAIVAGGEGQEVRRISYAELRAVADQVAHGLRHLDLAEGDAVALYLPMTVECVAAYLGIVQAGLVAVSIPDSFAPEEVATRLRLGGAKAVVTVGSFRRGGKEVSMYPKAVEAAELLSHPVRCICIADEAPTGFRPDEDLMWSEFLQDEGGFEAVPRDPYDATNILFSSGTTGEPKAIPWDHLTPIKSAADGHWHLDIHSDDVVAWPTNIGWMMGPWLIYASLLNNATMALYEGVPTTRGFVDFAQRAGVTTLGIVPAIVRAWRENGVATPGDLPGVRVFSSTGEPSNPHDYLYLMSLAGHEAPVVEYCGGTEVGGGHLTGTMVQPASLATFTTPAMGLDIIILDDRGEPVEVGGHGEIYLIPPSIGLSQRLLNRNHHEVYYKGCPTGPGGAVLRRHGDEVQRLPGGFFTAQGRADDTMNLGGIKVGSVELERVMDAHEAVSETAAVGIPPEGGGAERLVVFAVPAGRGLDTDSLKMELQDRIKKRLNPLFRIHDVVQVERLPRTASNKVMRRKLRAQYTEQVAA